MNESFVLAAAEGGNPIAGFFLLLIFIWIGCAVASVLKPKGWTYREERKGTLTPRR